MNIPQDIIYKYIKTKKKVRKIVTYKSDNCELKTYHRKIDKFLKDNFINSIFAKAYISKQSIYENAKAHLYNDYFIMMDVKDFFNTINHNNLIEKLYLELNRINSKITKKECIELVKNCSVKNVGIPLGFITSPILSNIYLKEFDGILYGKLKKLNLDNIIYTRYADDICISFKNCNFNYEKGKEIISITTNLLKRYRLKLNDNKTRSFNLNTSNHVKITGVNIVKTEANYRVLSVGKKIKNALFWDAVNCYNQKNRTNDEIDKIKGMQSFILSIEKTGYESCYSDNMMAIIENLGFSSLKELIDKLTI